MGGAARKIGQEGITVKKDDLLPRVRHVAAPTTKSEETHDTAFSAV
jgi:hypothetical protein